MTPMDFAGYETECWHIMYTAECGILPELSPLTDVIPIIPWYALQVSINTDNKDKTNKKKGQKKEQKKRRK